jgi:membrane-associated protease RseP (regulator of RpoE activity)
MSNPDAQATREPEPERDRIWLHALLLLATIGTTTVVGAYQWSWFMGDFGTLARTYSKMSLALNGLWYSLAFLAILGSHEAGHYVACRRYRIDASLPYFLPVPLPLSGTAGAIIRIRDQITTKRALFDIGVAGPIAGFVVLVPVLFAGIAMSRVIPMPPVLQADELGEPLLFRLAVWAVWGNIPSGLSLNMHPLAFAAWLGMLVTAVNLVPIGQFDGGHVAYSLFGRKARWITLGALGGAVALSFYSVNWILWTVIAAVLLYKFGWEHPPVWDEHVPLDRGRVMVAIFAIIMFALCFTPALISPLDLVGTR